MLSETPWLSISGYLELPTSTGQRAIVDGLDMRFETLKDEVPIKDVYNWVAPLPGTDRFLTFDHGIVSRDQAEVLVKRGFWILPDNWYEHAYGTLDGRNTKAAKRPRLEQGERSQDELDSSRGDLSDQLGFMGRPFAAHPVRASL